jgi:hypothetical protein
MKNLQKVGGYASIIFALQFLAIAVIEFAILSPQGDNGAATPAMTLISIASKSEAPYLTVNLLTVLFSLTVILVTFGVRERMQASATNPMRLAVIAASVASAMFLASGVVAFTGLPPAVAAKDAATYGILNALREALLFGAFFASGWLFLLIGWSGVSTKGLPTILSWLVLVSGVAGILGFLIPDLVLFVVVFNVIWGFWLGAVLLRSAPMMGTTGKN